MFCSVIIQTTVLTYLKSDPDGLYDISKIGIADRDDFLFRYGWSGYDTASCMNGHTKCAIYKCKFPASIISVFSSIVSTESEIQITGIKAMQVMYGCEDTHLEKARYHKFKTQASKGKIDPDHLPPTEDVTIQHSLRIHLQLIIGSI